MVKIGLQIKAFMENVTNLVPEDIPDFRFHLKIKCTQCGEINSNWQYVTLSDEHPLKGGRGQANYIATCKLCSKQSSLDIKEDSVKQESSNSKKTNTTGLRMEIIIAFAVMGVLLFICFVIITYLMCKNKKSSKKSIDGSGYYPNYNIRIPHLPDPRQAARYSYTNTYPGNYFYTKYPASHPYIPHY